VLVPPAEQAAYTAARGVTASVAGTQVAVGSRRMAEAEGVDPVALDALAARLARPGTRRPSGVYVIVDGKLEGAIGVGEPPRAGAPGFVAALRAHGVHVALLTGDEPGAARALAEELDIDEVHAALGPDEKKRAIAALRARWGPVAVVGDSVDDAAALAAGDVGIALARGAGMELAAAGVTVLRGDLDGVLAALATARRAARRMQLSLGLALGHAALAIAAFTFLPLGALAPLAACATTTAVLAAIVAAARSMLS
jgi:Cu+-exporting ATPase